MEPGLGQSRKILKYRKSLKFSTNQKKIFLIILTQNQEASGVKEKEKLFCLYMFQNGIFIILLNPGPCMYYAKILCLLR